MRVDYQNAEQPAGALPGEYDVIVCAWDTSVSQSGNSCVVLDYEIRQDVDQPCAGMKVRYDNFTFIDSWAWRFSQAAMAAGIPDGYDFETPEDFGRAMFRRSLRITVEQQERNGKKYAAVKRFDKSLFPLQQPPLPAKGQYQASPQQQYAVENRTQASSQQGYGQPARGQGQGARQQQPAQYGRTQYSHRSVPSNDTGFMNIPEGMPQEELPFN